MRKTITAVIAAILIVCAIIGFSACDNTQKKTPSYLEIVTPSGALSNTYLGEFTYGAESDKQISDTLSSFQFNVVYNEGGFDAVAKENVTVSVKKDEQDVGSLPQSFNAGYWNITYGYSGVFVSVNFVINQAATGTGYVLSGLPSTWEYSKMPNLTQLATVEEYDAADFVSENHNASLYYIEESVYENLAEKYTDNAELSSQLVSAANVYYASNYDACTFVPVGQYRFFASISGADNYTSLITSTVSVTVKKEFLNFTAPEIPFEMTYEYDDDYKTGNVKLSELHYKPYIGSLTATNSREQSVYLDAGDWVNPETEINSGTLSGKIHKMYLGMSQYDSANYELSNLTVDVKINVLKGAINPDILFDTSNNYSLFVDSISYETVFFNVFRDNGFTDSVFSLLSIKDSEGRTLPVYESDGTTLVKEGDSGASGKLLRTPATNYYYKYSIAINGEPSEGTYVFSMSLKDNENYFWHYNGTDRGSDPVSLNLHYELAQSLLSYDHETYIEVDKNGRLNMSFEINKNAYDSSQLSSLSIEKIDNLGNTYSDPDIDISADGMTVSTEELSSSVKIKISVPTQFASTSSDSFDLCCRITMPTSEKYKDVDFSNRLTVLKRALDPEYYPTVKVFGSEEYVALSSEMNGEYISLNRNMTVGEIFSNLDNDYATWTVSSSSSEYNTDDKIDSLFSQIEFTCTYKDSVPSHYQTQHTPNLYVYAYSVTYFAVDGEQTIVQKDDYISTLESYINGASNLAETSYTADVSFTRITTNQNNNNTRLNGTIHNEITQLDDSGLIPKYTEMTSNGTFDITLFNTEENTSSTYEGVLSTYSYPSEEFTVTDQNGSSLSSMEFSFTLLDYVHPYSTITFAINKAYSALTGDEIINEMSIIKTAEYDIIKLNTAADDLYLAFSNTNGDFCGYIFDNPYISNIRDVTEFILI